MKFINGQYFEVKHTNFYPCKLCYFNPRGQRCPRDEVHNCVSGAYLKLVQPVIVLLMELK
jgi:hypothetical protein